MEVQRGLQGRKQRRHDKWQTYASLRPKSRRGFFYRTKEERIK